MIQFRCWYCNRRYTVAKTRVGERLICHCKQRLKVPARDGASSRDRSIVDWCVETAVYGGGGAILGCLFGVFFLGRLRFFFRAQNAWPFILATTVVGFVAGFFCGERGINWIGRMIRNNDES